MTSSELVSPFNAHFLSAYNRLTESSIPLIGQIDNHVRSTHGKQLRPMMTMLSALCCGFPADAPADHPLFAVTAAIETLHASTLIHDDVVDNSDTRRGKPSVKSLWGNKVAVLLGDFYLAKVMHTLNEVDNKAITAIINDAVIQMSEGELLQLQYSGKYNDLYDVSETEETNVYLTIIEKKTASFMAACCQAGATFATDDTRLHEQARLFGLNIGLAFQMRDDILDYMPASITGKPQGNDLLEGKCTLPLILALQNSGNNTKEKLISLLNNITESDTNMQTIIQIVTDGGFLERAAEILGQYISKARETLQIFPDNQYRKALLELAEKLIIK